MTWGEREASLTGHPPEARDCNETKGLGAAWLKVIFLRHSPIPATVAAGIGKNKNTPLAQVTHTG